MILIITLIGHLAYGITNPLWKSPAQKVGTFPLVMIRSLGCLLIFLLLFLFSEYFGYGKNYKLSANLFVEAFVLCCLNSLGLIFFIKSLQHGEVSTVIGLNKLNIIIGFVIAFLFRGEEITKGKILLGLVVALGIYLVDQNRNNKIGDFKPSKSFFYIFLSRFFWGTFFLLIPYIKDFGILLFCIVLESAVFTTSSIFYVFSNKKFNFESIQKRTIIEILFLILLGCIGTVCLNFALAKMGIFLFAIIALIEPAIGLTFSKFYYKEKLEFQKILGIFISVVAVIIYQIYNSFK